MGTVPSQERVCWIVKQFSPKCCEGGNSYNYVGFFLNFCSPVSISTLVNKQIAVSKNRSAQPRGQVLEELWEELNVTHRSERTAHAVSQEAHRNTHTHTPIFHAAASLSIETHLQAGAASC